MNLLILIFVREIKYRDIATYRNDAIFNFYMNIVSKNLGDCLNHISDNFMLRIRWNIIALNSLLKFKSSII